MSNLVSQFSMLVHDAEVKRREEAMKLSAIIEDIPIDPALELLDSATRTKIKTAIYNKNISDIENDKKRKQQLEREDAAKLHDARVKQIKEDTFVLCEAKRRLEEQRLERLIVGKMFELSYKNEY